eukprot:5453923-Pyramimonas_sp.AAC.1
MLDSAEKDADEVLDNADGDTVVLLVRVVLDTVAMCDHADVHTVALLAGRQSTSCPSPRRDRTSRLSVARAP